MVGTRVYLGGLSYRVSERDIDRFFRSYYGIGDIVIKNGFAFVEFEDHREAEDAIYEMNGKELLGGRVTVEKAKGIPRNSRWARNNGGRMPMQHRLPQRASNSFGSRYGLPSRTKYRLTIMNLSSKVSWQDLKDFMRQAGEVTYADAHKHFRHEGVIEFATYSDMRNALIKLDGKDLCGRRIKLYDESGLGGSTSSRRSWRSRSRSRSLSRSRSPLPRSDSRSLSPSRSRSRSASYERDRSITRSPSSSRSSTPPPRSVSRSRSPSESRFVEKRRSGSSSTSRTSARYRDEDY